MSDLERRIAALERQSGAHDPEFTREYVDGEDGEIELLTLRGGVVVRRVILPPADVPIAPSSLVGRGRPTPA